MDDRGDSTKQSNTDSLSAELYPLTSVKIEDNRLSVEEQEQSIKSETDPLDTTFDIKEEEIAWDWNSSCFTDDSK